MPTTSRWMESSRNQLCCELLLFHTMVICGGVDFGTEDDDCDGQSLRVFLSKRLLGACGAGGESCEQCMDSVQGASQRHVCAYRYGAY
jgi:hypothetical protein